MPRIRRHPLIADCASLSTSVVICSGPTKNVTRKRNATSWPAVRLPSTPISTPITTTAADAAAALISTIANIVAESRTARTCDAACRSTAESIRAAVRSSTP